MFTFFKKPLSDIPEIALFERIEQEIPSIRQGYLNTTEFKASPAFIELSQKSPAEKAEFISVLATWERFKVIKKLNQIWDYPRDTERYSFIALLNLFSTLLKSRLPFSEDQLLGLLRFCTEYPVEYQLNSQSILNQISHYLSAQSPTSTLIEAIEAYRNQLKARDNVHLKKILPKFDSLLSSLTNGGKQIVLADENDEWGKFINQYVAALEDPLQSQIYGLLGHLQQANGSKPSAKFLLSATALTSPISSAVTENLLIDWLNALLELKPHSITTQHSHNGRAYQWTDTFFLIGMNSELAKGLVWNLLNFPDLPNLSFLLANLAEKCFQKIPQKGPASAAVGNACIYVLSELGLNGVAQLSRLKMRIKQSSTQGLIQRYLQVAAAKLQMQPEEIEDLAVPHFELSDGCIETQIGDYNATLSIESVQKVKIQWRKGDTLLKSEPAPVKNNFKTELKSLKETANQIQKNLAAQRDRIDRMFILDRVWTKTAFEKCYLQHGLMQFITKQLIWTFENSGVMSSGFWQDKSFKTIDLKEIEIHENTQIRLWHPVGKSIEEIQLWRTFMESHEIKQPIKQAFREVYLLTDAEIKTHSYSNRMAAHILKQHQFNMLAKSRGWRYSLLGAYDKGYESEIASLDLPQFDLRAEFWVQEVNADNAWNDTGIWDYVSTDQVRFRRLNQMETIVPLNEIPPIILSEVLRDTDLFVGVASVGNDPLWRDNGGIQQFRNYWESYSFGDLNELAKTRKSILERLIPRLKIAKVASIEGNFVIIKGTFRTYKIHIGSGNILMKPNDQYLCIVPDRSSKSNIQNIPFLPFEGDNILSIIISKAFLLAEDDKITDTTITSQIHHKH